MEIPKVDLDSFETLYNTTYANTLKYVACHCSSIDDISDIMQEVYIELYKIFKKKKLEINNINSYVIGIAKNRLKRYYGFKYKLQNIFTSYNNVGLFEK